MMTDDEWKLIDFIDQGSCSYSINRFSLEIRNNKTNRILGGWVNKGYRTIRLNYKDYLYHRIIAQMFIPNPENLPEVDHLNHDKLDNRICNLRWVSSRDNNMNKTKCNKSTSYNLIDSLPDDIVPLKYNDIIYENCYYSKSLDCVCMKRICDVICYRWYVDKNNGFIYTYIPISANKRKGIYKNKLLRELNIE